MTTYPAASFVPILVGISVTGTKSASNAFAIVTGLFNANKVTMKSNILIAASSIPTSGQIFPRGYF